MVLNSLRPAALPLTLALGLSVGYGAARQAVSAPEPSAETLLTTQTTILGQDLAYPDKAAPQITAAIVTLPPGAQTGWHRHDVPVFGYVLEGELTVSYQGAGEKSYRVGDAFMEAVGTEHDGRNEGGEPMRILAVFLGEQGVPNTVKAQ